MVRTMNIPFLLCRWMYTMNRYDMNVGYKSLLPGGRYFNSLMSQTFIHINNAFNLQLLIFKFLSHE